MSLQERDFTFGQERRMLRHEEENYERIMSRRKRNFPIAYEIDPNGYNEEREKLRQEGDFPTAYERDPQEYNEERGMSRQEGDFPMAYERDPHEYNKERGMSRQEGDFHRARKWDSRGSSDERRMSRHEEYYFMTRDERGMSRQERDFPMTCENDSHEFNKERRMPRHEKNVHASRNEGPWSRQEKDTHVSGHKRPLSRKEDDNLLFLDKRPMLHQERNPHGSRDKTPMSHQERNPHGSRDNTPMSRQERNPHGSRDNTPMLHQERNPRGSRDKTPMSVQERNPHGARKRTPMCQDRNSYGSRDNTPMLRQERNSLGPRDETLMSRQERNSHGPQDKTPMHHQDKNSHGSRDKRSMSHQKRDSNIQVYRDNTFGSVAVPSEKSEVVTNPKKRRRESATNNVPSVCSASLGHATPGTSDYCLATQRNIPQRKRKRNDSFELESQHIPEKKAKGDVKPIGYKALKIICCKEDENEAMSELHTMEKRYVALLNSQEEIRKDLFKLVIQSLMVLIKSTNRNTSAHIILESTYKQLLGFHFPAFIHTHLPQMDCNSKDELAEIISNIISILEAFSQRFAKQRAVFYLIQLVVTALRDKMVLLHQQGRVDEHILHRIASLKESKGPFHKEGVTEDTTNPPDDFREISVVPVEADFQEGTPFLRANVVNTAYRDTEHYLDVQFRLLREDFIMPLREGIQELRGNENGTRGSKEEEDNPSPRQNTFLYQDVRIINPVCHRNGGVYRIQINKRAGRLKHVHWRKFMIKRLKYGALVCLSADGFNTLLFAIVENRDFCDFELGLVELRFVNCDKNAMQDAIENKCVFQMIESESYFEAYRHNLKALQAMDEEKLPFKECIVHCKNANEPPSYMMKDITEEEHEDSPTQYEGIWNESPYAEDWSSTADNNMCDKHLEATSEDYQVKYMDMTSIADPDFLQKYDLDVSRVPVLDHDQWPSKEALGLDESQYRACQLALTSRFALIQGPPGTGKTYVGLKIAHALLDNRDLWSGEDKSPILMVSYTNHALDQFLMGLNNKEGVVRVGGRSREEKLKEHNIKELRLKRRKAKFEDENKRERGRIWKERKMIEETHFPNEASRTIADGYKGVLSVSKLERFMNHHHLVCLTSVLQNITEDAQLLQWLGVKQKRKEQTPNSGMERQNDSMFRSEGFTRFVLAQRVFEVEEDEDNRSDEREGPAVVCSVKDVKNPDELYSHLQSQGAMSDAEEQTVHDVFRLSRDKRWDLYRLWRARLERNYQQKITESQEEGLETLLMRLSEINDDEDYHILRNAKVIAMTTTCAARYRDILQRVKPKIVIVEEAAEVLEAHILTSLPLDCEHVILIGDHQQLRPSCTVYELAKKYKLNISMFERLVNLQMPCVGLKVQHRMRPEIASLMKHIYKDLANHQSVHGYDDVLGFKQNMFFINHRHSESNSDDSFSHSNEHEARFIVRLCRYILKQGYEPSQITILTPYLGQMFMIRQHMEEEENIRLTTIDNYQGEENDIILLSLVRSNDNGQVGFVNDINRACVALSRARMGLYVIGNFDLLSAKSGIWKKVVGDLKKSGWFGEELALCCQRHNTKVVVKEPRDFLEKVPCGGCRRPCNYRLDCGHACTLPCHPDDQEHKKFRCNKRCNKTVRGCNKGHKCHNKCGQECEPRCLYRVEITLPCSHVKKNARCSDDPRSIKCDERCPDLLKCGHQCQARCSQPCTTECQELVKPKDWPCGHVATIACSATPLDCRGPCGNTSCGHGCSGKCGECLQGRVHRRCTKTCGRVLVCGHECSANCTNTCPPCTNKCETKCKHSECRKKCGELCVSCSHECEWKCEHLKCNKQCGEICDRPRCSEPCRKRLQCKHRCRGLCNEPCICVECERINIQELFGTEDFDDETVRFIQLKECKHIFEVSALDRWVDMENDDQEEKNSIQPKVCPSCKTPIRTMMRYNNVIKKQQEDIERVKAKILDKKQPFSGRRKENLRRKLTEYLRDVDSSSTSDRRTRNRGEILLKSIDRAKHDFEIITFENQVELLTRCHKLIKKAIEIMSKIEDTGSIEMKDVCWSIAILKYLREKRIVGSVEREITDIELELARQKVIIEMCSLLTETTNRDLPLTIEHKTLLGDIRNKLAQASTNDQQELDSFLKKLEETRSKYPIDPPTREEKDQIIKAMGLSKGHWYKCRQGHIYAIGECGGAMQRGTCPECHDDIGGTSHRLAEGNEVATEMDGAQYSAWSEQANMENYDLQDLQD